MIFGLTILATALLLSVVAAYYSIMGLTAIFAAAIIPVIIMGASLELGKIVATVWLHNNWQRINWLFKIYLVPAVFFLMLLTSMGIFGLLSKAHSDQSLVSGDATARIAIYDETIRAERDNIDTNRRALRQMDEAVDQIMSRSTSEIGADRSVAVRRSQQKERGRLLAEITESQKKITALNAERAPVAAEVREVEAEVGPIRYIAALLYGDTPDANVLERAVRFVIIMIVLVFDPLALCLILAANKQFEWARRGTGGWVHDEKSPDPDDKKTTESVDHPQHQTSQSPRPFDSGSFMSTTFATGLYPPDDEALTDHQIVQINNSDKDQLSIGQLRAKESLFAELTTQQLDSQIGEKVTVVEILPEPAPRVPRAGNTIDVNGKRTRLHQFDLHTQNIHQADQPTVSQLQADNQPTQTAPTAGFGLTFPILPNKGDSFLRVDRLPTVLYKFNGRDWIEIDKEISSSYVFADSYLDHLIAQIDSGQYDPDLLSHSERDAIATRLGNTPPTV